jgi:hypothetical protein
MYTYIYLAIIANEQLIFGGNVLTSPFVTDETTEDSVANTVGDANKKKIEQCNAAIALLTASFSANKSLTAVIKRSRTM